MNRYKVLSIILGITALIICLLNASHSRDNQKSSSQLKELQKEFSPIIPNTHLVVSHGLYSATYNTNKTYSQSHGQEKRHRASSKFSDGGEIFYTFNWDYIGHNQLRDGKMEWGDHYLLTLKRDEEPTEYYPVIYTGGKKEIVVSPEITINFTQTPMVQI